MSAAQRLLHDVEPQPTISNGYLLDTHHGVATPYGVRAFDPGHGQATSNYLVEPAQCDAGLYRHVRSNMPTYAGVHLVGLALADARALLPHTHNGLILNRTEAGRRLAAVIARRNSAKGAAEALHALEHADADLVKVGVLRQALDQAKATLAAAAAEKASREPITPGAQR
jgi:hypothetical protein